MAYKQSQERKRRLKKLFNKTKNSYGSGVYYDKGRFIQYSPSRNSKTPRRLRKQSNKKYRKYCEILNHSSYKKLYDYWWELF